MKSNFLFLMLLVLLNINLFADEEMKTEIIPVPKEVKFTDQKFPLNNEIQIYSNSDSKEIKFVIERLESVFREGKNIFPKITEDESETGVINLILVEAGELSGEIPDEVLKDAYELEITSGAVEVKAVSERGLYYGVLSLGQMLKRADLFLKGVKITDYPDLSARGISDDISRGQVSTLENFKRIIDFISSYKMNVYMPYIEDVLEFESFPSIGKNRGALTKVEVRELVEYAESRFVDVIPVFQTLGHYENILTQPEFVEYAEFPGAASLNVSSEKTYEFIETLLKEVFEIFPSEYIHIGADESWDVGLGKSKNLVDSSNISQVHLQHYKRVYEIAKKNNKKVLMYGDIILRHPEILEELPKDIVIVDWHYRPSDDYPSTGIFREAGHKYFVSPSVWNFRATFPAYLSALPNIKYLTEEGIQDGASGMINSNWGDYGAETFKELVLFGYAYSAQCSWNIDKTDVYDFSKKFFFNFFGVDDEKALNVYRSLSDYSIQIQWNEIWRHPALDEFRSRSWSPYIPAAGKIVSMNWTLPQIEKDLSHLKKVVLNNEDHLDILQFLIDVNYYFILKNETMFMMRDKRKGYNIESDSLTSIINKNIQTLKKLKDRFSELWKDYYKPANLNMIDDKFDRLISYWNEIKADLKEGELKDPLLKSKWIYFPTADSNFADVRDESKIMRDSVKSAIFKKEFSIGSNIEEAYFQLMGDTYAKLFINGEFVDEVYARRSGSLLVDYRRIKFIDVKPFLKEGENEIKIEAKNFENTNYRENFKLGDAGVNITGFIKTAERIIQIETNNSWNVRKEISEEWETAVEREYRFMVIAPNFETKRSSWIERE